MIFLFKGVFMNKILEKEEKYNLWDFERDSLRFWPLIRSNIFKKYTMNKKAYAEPHYIINKYNIVLPKLWKHHLKTIYLLNVNRDCFDVLFFNTAMLRYFNRENNFYENRLYGRYFENFSKPLNFESSYRGFFPNILANNENTYDYYTLIMLAELYAKINKYSVYNMKDKTDIKLRFQQLYRDSNYQ